MHVFTPRMNGILEAAKVLTAKTGIFPTDRDLARASGFVVSGSENGEPLEVLGTFHKECIKLVDNGHLVMRGFKYCLP